MLTYLKWKQNKNNLLRHFFLLLIRIIFYDAFNPTLDISYYHIQNKNKAKTFYFDIFFDIIIFMKEV